MTIDHEGIKVTATNFTPSTDELKAYVKRARELVTESEGADVADNITSIKVTLCDDGAVDLSYVAHTEKFERIRRITGATKVAVRRQAA
ncbi:MAG: hypothetical protein IKP64_00405 [Selenomonadaceae bacterium]|nr:hypothetical protein [Selenomonadaceae bacterium]